MVHVACLEITKETEDLIEVIEHFHGNHTAVSTKVVPQKRESVRDNVNWYYG